MALFLSTFVNKVDKKGRVSVPASFRSALAQQTFPGIILFPSYKVAALEGCGIDRMQHLSDSIDHMDLFSEEQDELTTSIFADAHQLSFDGDGRVILPETLRHYAGINGQATFVGRGATFQIWESHAFEIYQQEVKKRVHQRGATIKLRPHTTITGDKEGL